jgi:hypothetical protein
MAGTGIRSFAKLRGHMLRFATTRIAPWQTALKWTTDCSALRLPGINAVRLGLWQPALKLILLSVAICSTVFLFVAIRDLNAVDCHTPRYIFERGA